MATHPLEAIKKITAVAPIEDTTPAVSAVTATPFSNFMDSAVKALDDLSTMEKTTNQLTIDYVQGKGSLENVMFETNKLSIAMQLAVSVVNSGVQAFKEVQQMQV